jgi:addiction module HigA family antidote
MPKSTRMAPVHPGELLAEDYMKPLGLTATTLATKLRVRASHIAAIMAGKRAITADMARRLGRHFVTSQEMWIGIQTQYDLDSACD